VAGRVQPQAAARSPELISEVATSSRAWRSVGLASTRSAASASKTPAAVLAAPRLLTGQKLIAICAKLQSNRAPPRALDWLPVHPESAAQLALLIASRDEPGTLYRVSEVIYRHGANISYIATSAVGETQIELEDIREPERLMAELEALEVVHSVTPVPSFQQIFGKRVIVIGGGAQVGMVAQGAISEADRHNIRGERISVDTIALVGEERLAAAVRAVARLHRARVLVLAGALMGGDITAAAAEIQDAGIIVICTNMAGSLVRTADIVVSDPLEAGVMAVMLIADTASFSIERVRGRHF
jgi:energy-converting hydrogenase B subunit Q